MSVIVKGMEPPENCCECDFNSGLCFPERHYYCECPSSATRGMNITDAVDNDIKHPDCPISSLPKKHGRLIDAEELIETAEFYETEMDIKNHSKTVIEAEGE